MSDKKTTIKILLQAVTVLAVSQIIAVPAGFAWIALSSDEGLGAGLSGIIAYVITSSLLIIIGDVIVLILNKKTILLAVAILASIFMLYSYALVFFIFSSSPSKNNVSTREATARNVTTIQEYETSTGFKLPDQYQDLELECEAGIDYACSLSFTMPESEASSYIGQFGFIGGIEELNEFNADDFSEQYVITHNSWDFGNFEYFLKGEAALTEIVDGQTYAGIGTKIVIGYENKDSTTISVFLFHID